MTDIVEILTTSIVNDLLPPVELETYLFDKKRTDKQKGIIIGIFKGLLYFNKGVSKSLFENCLYTNRLDELIHKKYTFKKSGYYNSYQNERIVIGHTSPLSADVIANLDQFEILTDDFCETCKTEGFITKEHYVGIDCICGAQICKYCSNESEKESQPICFSCDSSGLLKAIKGKINTYTSKDKRRFDIAGNVSVEDVKELLKRQNFRCYKCEEVVLTSKWTPECLYQFSLDRIENNKPHNKDIVLISCFYCNCINYWKNFMGKSENFKICSNKCHVEKKHIKFDDEKIRINIAKYRLTEASIKNEVIKCIEVESPLPMYNFKMREVEISLDNEALKSNDISPIMELIGIPIRVECIEKTAVRKKRNDNQVITYFMINPNTGFADDKWQGKIGKVILSRVDGEALTQQFVRSMSDYFCDLIEDFGNGTVPRSKMTKEYFQKYL